MGQEVQLNIVMFVLEGCAACHALRANFERVLSRESMADRKKMVAVHTVQYGNSCDFEPAALVRPRVFPTLIVYNAKEPVFGWEGFALMAPEDIQEDIVFDVLTQIFALIGPSQELEKNLHQCAEVNKNTMSEVKST